MGRPRGKTRKTVQHFSCPTCPGLLFDSEELLQEHIIQHPEEISNLPAMEVEIGIGSSTASPLRSRRRPAIPKSASPKKRQKTKASAQLALFSDIELTDLPDLHPGDDVEPVESHEDDITSQMVSKGDLPHLDDENPGPSMLTAVNPTLNIGVRKVRPLTAMSAELRKDSTTVPFVVSSQMSFAGDIPTTTVRSLQSFDDMSETTTPNVYHEPRAIQTVDQCEKIFECHHCRRVYFNIYSLKLHIRQQHTNSGRKVKCPRCDFVFFKLSGLRDHLSRGRCERNRKKKEEAEKKAREAAERGEPPPTQGEDRNVKFNVHVYNKIFEPLLERCMCIVEHKDGDASQPRKRIDPKRPRFKCDLCGRAFEIKDSLHRHYKQVHPYLSDEARKEKMKACKPPPVVFKCPIPDCLKILPSKKVFKKHYKETHPEHFQQLAEQHLRAMDDSVLYECPTCGRSYFHENAYLKHREECADLEEEYCGDDVEIDVDLLKRDPWIDANYDDDDVTPRRGRKAAARAEQMMKPEVDDSFADTQCRYCGKLFFTVYGRIDHERKHNRVEIEQKPAEEELIACQSQPVEEVIVEDSAEIETPSKPISGPIVIRCLDCNKMFHSFDALQRHHSNVHAPKPSGSVLRSQLQA